jgi:hypothetical protein
MKKAFILMAIYVISLGLSMYGFYIDSDPRTNSFAYETFEVVMLSFFIFGFLTAVFFVLYYLFQLSNKIIQRAINT